jgi:hypothetical protein
MHPDAVGIDELVDQFTHVSRLPNRQVLWFFLLALLLENPGAQRLL